MIATVGITIAAAVNRQTTGGTTSAAGAAVRFTEISHGAGVDFLHINGASADKHLVETIGSGGLFFDYDNDGWIDLYVTGFGPNTLYRNTGTGSFTDVTNIARVGSSSWSTGCAFADLDRDGDLDLFVTNYVMID